MQKILSKIINLEAMLTRKKAAITLLFLFLAYEAVFILYSHLEYSAFFFTDFDLAIISQIFHNTTKARFLPVSYGDFVLFGGGHISLMVLLLSPLYALFRTPQVLLVLQTLFLGAGIFAVYLIALELIGSRLAALVFSLAYIIYPALNNINIFEVHMVAFAIPLLLFMFYFFLKKKFSLFILFMLMSLFCQEDVFLVVLGFGVYALVLFLRKKLALKWSVTAIACGLIWFAFAFFLVVYLPKFSWFLKGLEGASKVNAGYASFYSWLGSSPFEIAWTFFANPLFVIKNIITPVKMKYMFDLLAPLGFSSLLSPLSFMIALFGASETLFSNWPLHNSILFQHSSMVIPFVFISAIFGVSYILKRLKPRYKETVIVVLFLVSLVFSYRIGPIKNLSFSISELIRIKNSEPSLIKNYFVKQVPGDAAVISTFNLSSHLTGRKLLIPFYIFTYDKLLNNIPQAERNSEYALVDFNDRLTFNSLFNNILGGLNSRCFLTGNDWGVVETLGSIASFKKGYKSAYILVESKGTKTFKQKDKEEDLRIIDQSFSRGKVSDFGSLDVSITAAKTNATFNNYLPVVRLTNDKGKTLDKALIIPFRLYPFREWKEGEVVRLRSKLYLEPDFDNEKLKVQVGFLRL